MMKNTTKKYNIWKSKKKVKNLLSGAEDLYDGKNLIIYKNTLKKIPYCIKELKELERLVLDRNNIRQIPDWIGELKNLEDLELTRNKIREIPTEVLKKCDSLKELRLNLNPIPNFEIERARNELNNIDIIKRI